MVDTHASRACDSNVMGVQVPPSAHNTGLAERRVFCLAGKCRIGVAFYVGIRAYACLLYTSDAADE